MYEVLEFKVFCLEAYRSKYGLTGREVIELFNRTGALDYIGRFYDVLHTQGESYIVDDLDSYIKRTS